MTDSSRLIQDFIRRLLSAITNASLYGMSHPQVLRLTSQAHASLRGAFENKSSFSLMVIENELLIDEQPQEFSLFLNRFAQLMKSAGIGHLKILSGISGNELTAFVAAISRRTGDTSKTIPSSENLRLGRVEIGIGPDSGETAQEASAAAGKRHFEIEEAPSEEMARFMEIYDTVKHHKRLKISGITDIVSGFVDAFQEHGRPLLIMASLRDTDEYTFTHSTNVCILNIAQASALGVEGRQLNEIGVAGMLHDIGKLFIPEDILTKKEKLTGEEIEIMKNHPVLGARYLIKTPGVPRLAVITAFEHHLKYNLSGYPVVPIGWKNNICSQITMISDFFDALRTRRTYREPVELQEIAGMMIDMMEVDFHPILTRNFLLIMSRLMET